MTIEFGGIWVVLGFLILILLGLVVGCILIECYIHFMNYKWKKQERFIKELVGGFERRINKPGGENKRSDN